MRKYRIVKHETLNVFKIQTRWMWLWGDVFNETFYDEDYAREVMDGLILSDMKKNGKYIPIKG